MKKEVPVGLSNRHCHLTEEHIRILFGDGYELTKIKDLSQPGQYACDECVDIKGPKGTLNKVRILGPARTATQIEILASDSFKLGVPAVVKLSGDHEGTPGAEIIGPKGSIVIDKGVLVAARHLHISPSEAEEYGVKDGDVISVKTEGIRSVVFNNVIVRCGESHSLDLHIDTEEGNAAGLKNKDLVTIL